LIIASFKVPIDHVLFLEPGSSVGCFPPELDNNLARLSVVICSHIDQIASNKLFHHRLDSLVGNDSSGVSKLISLQNSLISLYDRVFSKLRQNTEQYNLSISDAFETIFPLDFAKSFI
jgi:hypothetical protein